MLAGHSSSFKSYQSHLHGYLLLSAIIYQAVAVQRMQHCPIVLFVFAWYVASQTLQDVGASM